MIFKKNEVVLVILILILSFSVRWYKLSENLFFGFEQGRDALIIENIYKMRDFVLTGPSTSIGGVFHGPWYYYMMAFPYWVSGGNPLAASLFLVIIGSLVTIIMYFFGKDLFNSKFWGFIGGISTALSYEYILYSRWLSNVSPAPLFVATAFLVLWKYLKTGKQNFFLLFVLSASIASLFQMILIVQFIFLIIVLLIFKQLKIPPIKTIIFSFLIIIILFSPLILFDFRNNHITILSLMGFSQGFSPEDGYNFFSGLLVYLTQVKDHLALSLINIKFLPVQIFVVFVILMGLKFFYSKNKDKGLTIFLLVWVMMSLPLIVISPGNPQYYVGVGLGWILLFTLTLKAFWESKNLKIVTLILVSFFLASSINNMNNLILNKDVFFRTIQEDLTLTTQKKVLDFIHYDSKTAPYKLIAFTIPSLHPEGWEYLHKFYYPDETVGLFNIVYIVIEKNVYPVWENKWINDLGISKLIFEKRIDLLRIQKRLVE